jgi:RluA family pseudouridine synthase
MVFVFCDEALVAINKPAGVSSAHDGARPDEPTLVDMLRAELGEVWPVHRLDRDTSGVMVFARTEDSHRHLSLQFEQRETEKVYHALVKGRPRQNEQVINAPLLADADRKHRTVVDAARGKPAITRARMLQALGPINLPITLMEARPETGRTHQIRAHLAMATLPIVCDPLYGDGEPVYLSSFKKDYRPRGDEERPLIARMALHAFCLSLRHPQTGQALRLEAPYPKDFGAAVKQLGKLI